MFNVLSNLKLVQIDSHMWKLYGQDIDYILCEV